MNTSLRLLFLSAALCLCSLAGGAEWQWSVQLKGHVSSETNDVSRAFLWIPSDCEQVRAVVVGQHNMSEETLFEHPLFRERMSELGFALIWISPILDMPWDVSKGVQDTFYQMLGDLADVSGYGEIEHAPVVPLGHSALATYPWNFAAWNPDRTLAVISLHGDSPRTNLTGYGGANLEWGRTRNIDGIPGLMIEGEYEWWEARVNPSLAFRIMYPDSCISFFGDAGRGHFDTSDQVAEYIALFLKKAAEYRLPSVQPLDRPCELARLNPRDGWLADRWRAEQKKRPKAAPYAEYKGDSHDAFWYFDGETAMAAEKVYARQRGKKEQFISYLQSGELVKYDPELHCRIACPFQPQEDGLTFSLKPVYVDSTRTRLSDGHVAHAPEISRISGPVKVLDDSTFTVRFYRMGMNNKRRGGEIWLMAESCGDKTYKSAVQQVLINIPYRNTEGKRQHILFPGLPDVPAGTESLSLDAVSDCGLPVYYYIKEGPAEIVDGKIVFTDIPPRAKFPVKVTVAAWQYGLAGKVMTAEPVERSFFIEK